MKAKDTPSAPVPVLIETLTANEPLQENAAPAPESNEPVAGTNQPDAQKLATAVECLRFIERWARREQWDLRKRVIRALQDMGEWTA